MVETRPPVGLRQVLLVSIAVVAAVLGAAVGTSLLPRPAQEAIFHGPVLIAVLILGTGWLLWRISRPRPGGAVGEDGPDDLERSDRP